MLYFGGYGPDYYWVYVLSRSVAAAKNPLGPNYGRNCHIRPDEIWDLRYQLRRCRQFLSSHQHRYVGYSGIVYRAGRNGSNSLVWI
jgi:hypothetical protein